MSKSNKNKKDSILVEDNKKIIEKVNVEDLNINEIDNIQFVNIEEKSIENNINDIVIKINNRGRIQRLKINKKDISFVKTTAKLRKEK